jgi:type IV secretion system protein VirB1
LSALVSNPGTLGNGNPPDCRARFVMNLSLPLILMLAQHCAPDVAPETLISVAHVESRFDPLTIGVNGQRPRTLHPSSKAEAVRQAGALIASGVSVDLGLGQINSRNLGWLGLSLEDAFDPCRNLAAAAKVLASNYATAAPGQDAQAALRVAFSMYNTGDAARGFRNGYVQKVSAAAQYVVPAIKAADADPAPSPVLPAQPVLLTQAAPESPAWDVFATPQSPVMVFPAESAPRGHQTSKPRPHSSGARR